MTLLRTQTAKYHDFSLRERRLVYFAEATQEAAEGTEAAAENAEQAAAAETLAQNQEATRAQTNAITQANAAEAQRRREAAERTATPETPETPVAHSDDIDENPELSPGHLEVANPTGPTVRNLQRSSFVASNTVPIAATTALATTAGATFGATGGVGSAINTTLTNTGTALANASATTLGAAGIGVAGALPGAGVGYMVGKEFNAPVTGTALGALGTGVPAYMFAPQVASAAQSGLNAAAQIGSVGAVGGGIAGLTLGLGVPMATTYLGHKIGRSFGYPAVGTGLGATVGVGAASLGTMAMGAPALAVATPVGVTAAAGAVAAPTLYGLGAWQDKIWQRKSTSLLQKMGRGLVSPVGIPLGLYSRWHEWSTNNSEKFKGKTVLERLGGSTIPTLAKGAGIGTAAALGVGAGLAAMPVAAGLGVVALPVIGTGAKLHEKVWGGPITGNWAKRTAAGIFSPLTVSYKLSGAHYAVKNGPWSIFKSLRSLWNVQSTESEGLGQYTGWAFSRPLNWSKRFWNFATEKTGKADVTSQAKPDPKKPAPTPAPDPASQPTMPEASNATSA